MDLTTDQDISNFMDFAESISGRMKSTWDLTCDIVYGGDHFKKSNQWLVDFTKYFNLIVGLKKHRVHLRLRSPDRMLSPYWFYFEDLEG